MIVLACKFCGNNDLTPAITYYETICNRCNRLLQLWEMQPVHLERNEQVIPQMKQSELNVQNLT